MRGTGWVTSPDTVSPGIMDAASISGTSSDASYSTFMTFTGSNYPIGGYFAAQIAVPASNEKNILIRGGQVNNDQSAYTWGAWRKIPPIIKINEQITAACTTTFKYLGLYYKIPANSYFCVHGRIEYNTTPAVETAITLSNGTYAPYISLARNEGSCSTFGGYTPNDQYIYLWGRCEGSGNNSVHFRGWYSPAQ